MKHFLLPFLAIFFICSIAALAGPPSVSSGNNTKDQKEEKKKDNAQEQKKEDEQPPPEEELQPPELVLNDQKIIFNRQPMLDSEGWLFPLEEIAAKLQDNVKVDIVSGLITIWRSRDKSIIQLNVKNGIVTVNNRPFKTLFGYQRIILGNDVQMVPTTALVMLLGLTSEFGDNKLVLKNTIGSEAGAVGTVQPLSRNGMKDLLVDYLTVTNSFDYLKTSDLYSRRTEINNGFHNDNYALTSDFIFKAGTETAPINFDSANISFYKNASPLQVHFGDKPLSQVKSPLLGGIVLRGIQAQTSGPIKDSKFVFASGLLPTNGKVLGKGLPFVRYGRLAEITEFSTSPDKAWQFSIGQATYTDLITNQLVKSKQDGGLFALSLTKTGKYIEGNSNLAFGVTTDKVLHASESGPAADLLLRFKPARWLSFHTKGSYYSPGFFALSGNPYFHDRNEVTVGLDLTPPRSNIGISQTVGQYNLNNEKPSNYDVTNIYASSTLFKNGPTLLTSYSQNKSQISSTRALDNLLFPITPITLQTSDLETLIERRTNSFFRASLLKSWKTVNITSSFNYFTFSNESPLRIPFLKDKIVNTLWTYDLNVNKYLNKFLGLQTYLQGSDLYKQVRFGLNIGPVLNNRLNMQLLSGALIQAKSDPTAIHSLNLNYQVNKKNQFSLKFDKTAFLTSLSGLWQYNLRPQGSGHGMQLGEEQSIGRIRGRVVVLEEPEKTPDTNKLALLASSSERGLGNVRIHLGNYIIRTDENGVFEFPSLTPGVHRLKVEYSDLPSYLTSITPEAVDVKVVEGKETNFNFVLAYFGSLTGKLQLAGEPPLNLAKEPELQDIRVYLAGSEFETLTNPDGSFVLGDVKPGKYKLKVDPDFLPEELEIDNAKEIEVNIHGKEKIENVQLPVKFRTKVEEIKEF